MQRGYAIESEIRENRERLNQIKLDSDRAIAQRRHNEERCAELTERSAASETESGTGAAAPDCTDCRTRFQPADAGFGGVRRSAAQAELAHCQQEPFDATNALTALEVARNSLACAIMEAVAATANLRNRLTQAEERMAADDREAQRLQTEMASANFRSKPLADNADKSPSNLKPFRKSFRD